MAISLAEGAKYSLPDLQRGVIQSALEYSDLMSYLKWSSMAGNAKLYNRETSLGSAAEYAPGDTWTESTAGTTQVTAKLKIFGGDAEIDEFGETTGDTPGAIAAEQIPIKIRDTVRQYELRVINGNETSDAKQFDGLRTLCTSGNSNRITMGTNGATLTLKKLDEVLDLIYGKPGLLLMTKRSRRTIADLARSSSALASGRDEFSREWLSWHGVPIAIMDRIGDGLTKGSSSVASEIYCCDLTPGYGVNGLQNEKTMQRVVLPTGQVIMVPGPQVIEIGPMETKDAKKYRVRFYAGLQVGALRGISCLDGVLE
jgi:hypothetical protein